MLLRMMRATSLVTVLAAAAAAAAMCVLQGCDVEPGALHALDHAMLPEVGGSRYVRLTCLGAHRNWIVYDSPLVGNAWLVKENADAESELVINGCERVRVYDEHVLAELRRRESGTKPGTGLLWPHQGYSDGRLGGEWVDADLRTDVTNVIGFLRQMLRGPEHTRYGPISLHQKARLLLFASNVAQAGHRGEAMEIAGLLLKLGGDGIVRQAISQVGDARYAELCRELKRSGDREAFLQGLMALVDEFGDQWEHRIAVERQISSLQRAWARPARSEDEETFLAALDNHGLGHHGFGWWVLPGSQEDLAGEETTALHAFLRKRLRAMPLLISLLDDYAPTSVDIHDYMGLSGPGWRCMTGWHHVDPILMRRLEEASDLLPRPVTRAEMARDLLEATAWLTEEERTDLFNREWGSEDPFVHYERTAQTWYEDHRGKSDLDLCREFLSRPWTIPQPVMEYLLGHGDESDVEAVEQRLLQETYAYSAFDNVLPYVRLRGKKAADFLDAYEAALMAHVDQELEGELEHAQGVWIDTAKGEAEQTRARFQRVIEDLRAVMDGTASVSSVLQEIVSGRARWNDACKSYWQALSRKDPDAGLREALSAALQADDAFLRWLVVQSAVANKLQPQETDLAARSEEPVSLSAEDRTAWRRLLDDTREGWDDPLETSRLGCQLELLIGTQDTEDRHNWLVRQLGSDAAECFVSRAYDIVDGKAASELTALPCAARVPRERREEIAGQLRKDAAEAVLGLTLDEKLALSEILDADVDLNRTLVPYANRVTRAEFTDENGPRTEELQRFNDRTLDRIVVQDLVDECRNRIQAGRFVHGGIYREPLLRGVRIELKSMPAEQLDPRWGYFSYRSYLTVRARAAGGRDAFAMWPVSVPDEVRRDVNMTRFYDEKGREIKKGGIVHTFGPRDEVNRKHLWEVIDYMLGGEDNVAASQEITWEGEVGRDE